MLNDIFFFYNFNFMQLKQKLLNLIKDIEKNNFLYKKPVELIKPILFEIAEESDELKAELLNQKKRLAELENNLTGVNCDVTKKNE